MNKIPHPPLKSYVLRQRRLTSGQRRAFETAWSHFGLEYGSQPVSLDVVFDRQGPCVLEIGFGNGESLLKQAIASPEINFIGIEVYSPGIGSLIAEASKRGLSNLRIFQHNAVDVLTDCISNNTADVIQIFFPDPWPKKRHHKRRLIQANFVDLLVSKLKVGGRLHCATDWKHYAKQMMSVLSASALINIEGDSQYFSSAYALRPLTKFERRGLNLGHKVWDLVFIRE